VLETKTAETDHATEISLSGCAWIVEHDRKEKIYVLDVGRADRGWAALIQLRIRQ
jgi:hypothetical protein